MPISHLLSESFYLDYNQQHDHGHETLSAPNNSFQSGQNGSSRHVQFDDKFSSITYFQREKANYLPGSSDITETRFEPSSSREQKIPRAHFESNNDLYPYVNYEDLNKNIGQLQLLVTYVCQSSDRKVTNKVALNGYAYTKRGGKSGVYYWYCDQRKICSASLIEKNGTFSVSTKVDSNDSRSSSKRGWGPDGRRHEAHPPDNDRINKEISTRARRLERRKRAHEKRVANNAKAQEESRHQTATEPFNSSTEDHGHIPENSCNENVIGDNRDSSNLRIESVWGHENVPNTTYLNTLDNVSTDSSATPVLIDTDGGFYDAWALSLALTANTANTFKVVGITTVNGCTTASNAVRNIGRVLQTIGSTNMPVFKGMDSPLLGSKDRTPRPAFFGSDGFGDVLTRLSPDKEHKVVSEEHGVNAIIKLAEKYKGKLTILALGPLTNLAMAIKLQPEIKNHVKEIFILGGNSEGVGNVTVCGEFNFYADPEAAHIVLENFNACPVYLLPWETCMRSAASTYAFRMNTIGMLNSPLVTLLNKVESKNLSKHCNSWVAPDAVVVACFMNHEVMRKTEHYHCSVELQGKHTRGMMIVDKNFMNQKPANVMLITEIDLQAYEEMLVGAVVVGNQNEYNTPTISSTMKLEQNYF